MRNLFFVFTSNVLSVCVCKIFLQKKKKKEFKTVLMTSFILLLANTLNNFFSNIIKILKTEKYYVKQKFRHNLFRHQILKAIIKYKNHSSIIINSFFQRFSSFYFLQVDKKAVLLKTSKFYKAVQETDPHARILKGNADNFTENTCLQINEAITVRCFKIQTFSGRNFPIIGLNTG